MPEIILHQYDSSPFAYKARLYMGFKKLAWRAVEIPMVMPKPLLMPLTGGYRKTPVMQIGADIYFDTSLIAAELERRHPSPSFYPAGGEAMAQIFTAWADQNLFLPAANFSLSLVAEKLPAVFFEDRAKMMNRPVTPVEKMKAATPLFKMQMCLQLDRLTVLFDDNAVSIDGGTDLSVSDDQCKRFAAAGWAVRRVDGHDHAEVAAALSWATRNRRPTLIACRTIIGFGAPTKAGTAATHGSPLGAAEAAAAKQALGWNHPPFTVPEGLKERWEEAGRRGGGTRRSWLKRLANHPQREEFERAIAGRLPESWHAALAALRARQAEEKPKLATRAASGKALEALVPAVPELIGGSADLTGSVNTLVKGMGSVAPGNFAGRYIHYGVREHGMAAAMNGMALHGGVIPYAGTFLVFSDYMRPAIRLAALMRQQVIHVLTHDSIGLGEDGPTHQPVEHLASLRAMPNLAVFRPADAIETAECWELAVKRADGPSVLALTRQNLPALRGEAGENRCARGGYVLAEAPGGERRATLIATGSEVHLAMAARAALEAEGIPVAVASLPCWEIFAAQDEGYRSQVLGGALRVGVEAAVGFGWERWLGPDGVFIGMSGFGASAPAEDLFRHFGITAEAVVAAVKRRLNP